jgi:hypothetical protein
MGKESAMPYTAPFYSVNEEKKEPEHRVHHNKSNCPAGKAIPPADRLLGTNGYRLCEDCPKVE